MKLWVSDAAARLWTIIVVGAGAGLLAAYGKEQHEGRKPDWKWLAGRLAIAPILAGAAAAAADQFGLKGNVLGFVSAMLSLLGYDALRAISSRALKKVEPGEATLPADALVKLPPTNAEPPVVKVERPSSGISGALHETYDAVLKEALPDEHEEPLRRLGKDDPKP